MSCYSLLIDQLNVHVISLKPSDQIWMMQINQMPKMWHQNLELKNWAAGQGLSSVLSEITVAPPTIGFLAFLYIYVVYKIYIRPGGPRNSSSTCGK